MSHLSAPKKGLYSDIGDTLKRGEVSGYFGYPKKGDNYSSGLYGKRTEQHRNDFKGAEDEPTPEKNKNTAGLKCVRVVMR